MQIGNGSIYRMNPMTQCGGITLHNNYLQNQNPSVIWRARTFGKLNSVPSATEPPYSCILAQKGGDLASRNVIRTEAILAGPAISLGLACAASLTGQGEISAASLSLIIQLIADLTASGEITSASLVGSLSLAADLVGQGDLDGALALIVWMAAELSGAGDADGSNLTGLGNMSCDITSQGEVVTAQACAAAVWNAIATSYNETGSMGQKLNSAAAGGVDYNALAEAVWDAEVSGRTVLQAGKILEDVKIKTNMIPGLY